MELPSSKPRHITIFSVPAGTPSCRTNMKLGRFIPSAAVDHWGIYIESADDYITHNGLCVELDRTEEGGIMARHRTRRQREEKEPQEGIKYDYTGEVTLWEDERIVQCAKDVCKDHMFGNYHVINGNCQTLVNLLVQRIADRESYIPRSTASHTFSKAPSNKNLVGIWEADMVPAKKLQLIAKTQAAGQIAWNPPQSGDPGQQSFPTGQSSMGYELDLSQAAAQDDLLSLEEQRLNAYYLSNPIDGESEPPQKESPGYGASQVPYSNLDSPAREEAFKTSIEKSFKEAVNRTRGMNTLAASLAAYDDPRIPIDRREEKRKRLVDLNSLYLRSKRAALMAQASNSGRLAQIKARGQWEEPTPEQLRPCLESWLQADEQDSNPEIVYKEASQESSETQDSDRA